MKNHIFLLFVVLFMHAPIFGSAAKANPSNQDGVRICNIPIKIPTQMGELEISLKDLPDNPNSITLEQYNAVTDRFRSLKPVHEWTTHLEHYTFITHLFMMSAFHQSQTLKAVRAENAKLRKKIALIQDLVQDDQKAQPNVQNKA